MSFSDDVQHDILLIIVIAIVILFTTGISDTFFPSATEGPTVIPVS